MKAQLLLAIGLAALSLIVASGSVFFWVAGFAARQVTTASNVVERTLSKLNDISAESCVSTATELLDVQRWLTNPPVQNFRILEGACLRRPDEPQEGTRGNGEQV